jgi:hypothetical protein
MNQDVKKYICKAPTNRHEIGAEVMLTEAQVENFNAGEAEPRFVLAEDQTVTPEAAQAPADTTVAPEAPVAGDAGNTAPPTGTGEAPQAGIDGNASAQQ